MRPRLFPADATTFTTQGLGVLSDATYCQVTEERNGIFELEMEYPISGIHYGDIGKRSIIMAIPSPYRTEQPFRVYKIAPSVNDGMAVISAAHISYDLRGIPVMPFTATNLTLALDGLANYAAVDCPFTFDSDKASDVNFSVKVPTACRSLLGGVSGSILDTYGGEYFFDGLHIRLCSERGANNGVTIRYGKNLTALAMEDDEQNVATGVLPYWAQEDAVVYGDIQWAESRGYDKVLAVDFSDRWTEKPTATQLNEAGLARVKELCKPVISLDVEFAHLSQMTGYEGLELLEKCDLCDTVNVHVGHMGVDVTAKIVAIKTDVLQDRYVSVTVGSIPSNIAQTIVDQQKEMDAKPTQTMMQAAISAATALLSGGKGGYVVLHTDAAGKPYELLIMDTDDIATAQNVWRWNINGWGHSSTGYNGPYTTAATMDGTIVADMIKAGTMLADRILGGTLTLGGINNANGVLVVQDSSGDELGRWTNAGIQITDGDNKTTMTRTGVNFNNTTSAGSVFASRVSYAGLRIQQDGYLVTHLNNGNLQLGYVGMTETPISLNGKTGSGAFTGTVTQGSDRRLKTDIAELPEELVTALMELAPKLYRLRLDPDKPSVGLIAQEIQGTPLEDVLVVQRENGLLHLDYTSLHGLLLAALQHMDKRLQALEKQKGETT